MNIVKSTLAIAAIAAAVSAPINTVSAGEGPYEIKGMTVFEIQRAQQAKKMTQATKGSEQVVAEDTKPNWLERLFRNTKKSDS